MVRLLHIIGLCSIVLPVWAGENIVLQNGFSIAAERHEITGSTLRIFVDGGVTEMPANLLARVDQVESPVPEPPEPAPAPVIQEKAPEPTLPIELTPAQLAASAAFKYSMPPEFVASVMKAESDFNPAAISPKGAIGLMQLMPDTAKTLGADPKKPAENADAGARYLHDLLAKYEGSPDQVVLALAAYNAGPAAVEKYHGVPPYRETREYILRVLKGWSPASAPKQ
jgi:hypothetical protein